MRIDWLLVDWYSGEIFSFNDYFKAWIHHGWVEDYPIDISMGLNETHEIIAEHDENSYLDSLDTRF
jgi:hypothetical protein